MALFGKEKGVKIKMKIECDKPEAGKCPHCDRREAEIAKSEEINLAILIALVPAMAATLFSGMGLF